MFGYYLSLALRSLRRNFILAALMVIAIGVGIGASMTMLTIFRAASGDPIPGKSARLFTPQLDNFGPGGAWRGYPEALPPLLTYLDVSAWMRAHVAVRQAAMYPTRLSITPADPTRNPIRVDARATYADFFPMFDVPFEYGGPWNRTEDEAHATVVVLTRPLNDLLFGGTNSVGSTLTIDAKVYRIIGVLDKWRPSPRFYDVGGQSYSGADELFVPFTRAIDEQMQTDSTLNCDSKGGGKGWDGLLHSNCIWMSFWAELTTADEVTRYRVYLHNYATEQRRTGRFAWLPKTELRDVTQWLSYSRVVPSTVDTLTGVSFALLAVCVLNAVGLLLANFMARSGTVCVRRALGATRPAIFAQFMIEAGVIGLVGGLLGIGLTELGLLSCRVVLQADLTVLTRLHGTDVLIATAVALGATLLAGLYPTWRATRVEPALQLKTL